MSQIVRMTRTLISALLLSAFAANTSAQSADGYFVTIDDETHAPKGLVELRVADSGELEGFLRGSFDPASDMSGTCDTCPEEMIGLPVMGLRIVYGLEPNGDVKFKKGRVVDPEAGKTYKAKVEYSDDFDTVELRGYIGSPVLGRTQTWRRATADELAVINANNAAFGLAALPVE